MNFGCGTLVVLLLLVVVAGQLIPHGSTKPALPQTSSFSGREQDGGKVLEKGVKPSLKIVEAPQASSFEALLSDLKIWLDEKALEAEHHFFERAALPQSPAAEVLAQVGEEAKALLSSRFEEVTVPALTAPPPGSTVSAEKNAAKSAPLRSMPNNPVAPPSTGAKLAVEGRDPVFNNPWNHAVEPVERYLKQHVHDAASIDVLEWGEVEITRAGYQVRCVYKSKNVLGKMTTQSRLFVLDHSGKVVEIRD